MRLLLVFGISTLTSLSFGQTYTLNGKIVNTQGEPLIAATVLIKGTSIGTVADINGDFTLEHQFAEGEHNILISYHHHRTIETTFEGGRDTPLGEIAMRRGKGLIKLAPEELAPDMAPQRRKFRAFKKNN